MTWPTIRVCGTSTVLQTHAETTSCRPVRNELCGGKQFWKRQPKKEGSASNVRPTEDAVRACLWRNTKLSFAIRLSRRLFRLAFTGDEWRLLFSAKCPKQPLLESHCSKLIFAWRQRECVRQSCFNHFRSFFSADVTQCMPYTCPCTTMGPVPIRHSSHHFGWQSSHSVDLAGCQAKMASIEIWIPWRDAHKPHYPVFCSLNESDERTFFFEEFFSFPNCVFHFQCDQ